MSHYGSDTDDGWKPVWDAVRCEIADTSPAKPKRKITILIIIISIIVYIYTGDLMFESVSGMSVEKVKSLLPLAGVPCISEFACPKALLTSIFIHWGIAHLVGNMFFLWIVGDNVETVMGSLRYALLFIISGIVGTLTQAVFTIMHGIPPYPLFIVGASGAIAGVMGAYLLLWPGATHCMCMGYRLLYYCFKVSASFKLGLWILFQIILALTGLPVGIWAHLSGFITGLALASILTPRENIERQRDELHRGRYRGMKPYIGNLVFPSLQPWVKWVLYIVIIILVSMASASIAKSPSITGDYYVIVSYTDAYGRIGYQGLITKHIPDNDILRYSIETYTGVKDVEIVSVKRLLNIEITTMIVALVLLLMGIFAGRALEHAESYEVTYIGFERAKKLVSEQTIRQMVQLL